MVFSWPVTLLACNGGVPHLGGTPAVDAPRLALDVPPAGGTKEDALRLYRGETFRPVGQVRERAVPAGGARERHDRRGVQVAVRGQ